MPLGGQAGTKQT